jgi:hypothetical protein
MYQVLAKHETASMTPSAMNGPEYRLNSNCLIRVAPDQGVSLGGF